MTTVEKMRQEARHNERISVLDRDQARLERQMAEIERKRQAIVQKIKVELRHLQSLQRMH